LTNFINDTICSLSTPLGNGAIAIIRVSGPDSLSVVNILFRGNNLLENRRQKLFYGEICHLDEIIDEVLITVFRAPHSFTRQDTVEISCHNSNYILKTILTLLQSHGARLARPGEFTQRAFLNGRFDLAQAEAIAELIASDSKAAHQTAMSQMRGGFSHDIKVLRNKLIDFASLLELELDFGEEDVEFAKRDDLKALVRDIQNSLLPLLKSFHLGNTLKNGIPTVIAGKPNAGKSTLLNSLLNEERAIVSDIPGTTRDMIEDEFVVEGIKFRLIDTAGLRDTQDTIEAIGVARTQQKMKQASLILYLFDPLASSSDEIYALKLELNALGVPYLLVGNKLDVLSSDAKFAFDGMPEIIWISASHQLHLDYLVKAMVFKVQGDQLQSGHTIITNVRHYEHLKETYEALARVAEKIDRFVTSDWLALDIREAMNHLGEITGEITTDDLLTNIFSRFCIGK
jgi:tRNA modification GTPase